MNDSTKSKIEYYLSKYELLDAKISDLKFDILDYEYNQTYYRYMKHKSSGLEEQAIRNINIEKKIAKIEQWKKLISQTLKYYKKTDIKKYYFIILKYFRKEDFKTIEDRLKLSYKEQKDMKHGILEHIFFAAIKNNMLHREE